MAKKRIAAVDDSPLFVVDLVEEVMIVEKQHRRRFVPRVGDRTSRLVQRIEGQQCDGAALAVVGHD